MGLEENSSLLNTLLRCFRELLKKAAKSSSHKFSPNKRIEEKKLVV